MQLNVYCIRLDFTKNIALLHSPPKNVVHRTRKTILFKEKHTQILQRNHHFSVFGSSIQFGSLRLTLLCFLSGEWSPRNDNEIWKVLKAITFQCIARKCTHWHCTSIAFDRIAIFGSGCMHSQPRYELWIYNEIIINTMCYNFHLNR